MSDEWADRLAEHARCSATDREMSLWSVELIEDGYTEWAARRHVHLIRMVSRRLGVTPSQLPEALETLTQAYSGRDLTAQTRRSIICSLDLWHDRAEVRVNS